MNVGFFKIFILSLLLGSLLWAAACATGPGPTESSYTSYSTPGTPLAPEESDPQFWQIWVDMHGGG
jgi:hypothetical protein